MPIDDKELSAAKDRDATAHHKLYELETKWRDLKQARTDAFNKSLAVELGTIFAEPLAAARTEKIAAAPALEAIIESRALASTTHEIPPGTPMEEWKVPGRYGYGGEKRATGKLGVIEIITRASTHPANKSYKAAVGSLVIRVLKRDGTPGKDYVSDAWTMQTYWRQSTAPQKEKETE